MAENAQYARKVARGWLQVNSFTLPENLQETELRWLINGVTRGGYPETRPGIDTLFDFTLWGFVNPQMQTLFTPVGDRPWLVFASDGFVYAARSNSKGGFDAPLRINNIRFSPFAPQIMWSIGIKSQDLNGDGTYIVVDPYPVLIMQDGGSTRAAYWDGTNSGHFNPTPNYTNTADGGTLFSLGYNEVPCGSWMAWSGNRLWVAVGNLMYASDLNDPTHFTEQHFEANITVFTLPDIITGMIDRGSTGISNSSLVVFTANTTTVFQSGVLQRAPLTTGTTVIPGTGWEGTSNFQQTIYGKSGCIAGKGITLHEGLLWWYSEFGIVIFDQLTTANYTQDLPIKDQALQYSKSQLAQASKKLICAANYEDYVFFSVPSSSFRNRQTQVCDKKATVAQFQLFNFSPPAWQGVWQGINPVEWTTGIIDGHTRIFALSKDDDGIVRIYEAMKGQRADNGQAIPVTAELRTYLISDYFDLHIFKFLRMDFSSVLGAVEVSAMWKGLRGAYKSFVNEAGALWKKLLFATPGGCFNPGIPLFPMRSFLSQWREVITPEQLTIPPNQCSSAGVESPWQDSRDYAFSFIITWQGRAALRACHIITNPADTRGTEGDGVVKDETGDRIIAQCACPTKANPGRINELNLPQLQPEPSSFALIPLEQIFCEPLFNGQPYKIPQFYVLPYSPGTTGQTTTTGNGSYPGPNPGDPGTGTGSNINPNFPPTPVTPGGGQPGSGKGNTTNTTNNYYSGTGGAGTGTGGAGTQPPNTDNPAISGGSITVVCLPSAAVIQGAMWKLGTNGGYQPSGTTLTGIAPGVYSVTFKPVAGWTTPSPQMVTILAGEIASASGTYQPIGSLQVTLLPSNVPSTAMWSVDGGPFMPSGATVSGLTPGNHNLTFNDIAGWTSPSNQTVEINQGQTTQATGTYILIGTTGSVLVTIQPQGAIDNGAEWNVDGGAWQASGATVSGLTPGNHTINFKGSITNYTAPAPQTVSISAGITTPATGTYTSSGLTVSVTPVGPFTVTGHNTLTQAFTGTVNGLNSGETVTGWSWDVAPPFAQITSGQGTATATYFFRGNGNPATFNVNLMITTSSSRSASAPSVVINFTA